MDYEKTMEELKHMKVETGSFVCLGCGHEHNCSIRGCAILRDTVECIEEMKRVLRESEAARAELGRRLAAVQQELAAYKDTGLEPEEIERIVDAYGRGYTLRTESAERLEIVREIKADRLRELVQAEQDGRLVVLPQKTVWELTMDAGPDCDMKCPVDAWDESLGCDLCSKAKQFAYERPCTQDLLKELGKTVFLNREEAEAVLALKGGESDA